MGVLGDGDLGGVGVLSCPETPAEDLIEEIKTFTLSPYFLYNNTPILGGHVTLVLNGSVAKKFTIPPQVCSINNFSIDIKGP